MPIVKELSRVAAAPGSPPILGRAAQEIIRQGEEIERLQEVLRTIAFRAQDAKRLCEEGAPISAYNLASGILGQIGAHLIAANPLPALALSTAVHWPRFPPTASSQRIQVRPGFPACR